jgi:hypothetical protein
LDRAKGDVKKAKSAKKTQTTTNKGVPKVKQPKPTEKVDNKKKKEYGENDGGVGPKTTNVTVFSGHGSYEIGSGIHTIPDGTYLTTFSKFGSTISDPLGNVIETGGDLSKVYKRTYGPGDRIPNYTLHPPDGLDIQGSPVTVTKSKKLSELLEPDMGECSWAACTWNPKAAKADIMYSKDGIIDTKDNSQWKYVKEYEKD